MLKLNKLYRRFYRGEDIVVERTYKNGIWHDTTENVSNAVINSQISNQAVVIGNGPSRLELFKLDLLKKHRGGLLGSRKLQTYGCNALYRDFTPDFLIARGNGVTDEIAKSKYTENNIVYTDSIHLLEYPNKFYLIPYDPYTDAGTTAAYIAAFDGHNRVYMIGFDGQDTANFNYNVYAGTTHYDAKDATVLDNKWIKDRATLFRTYNETEFIRVTKKATEPVPEEWKYYSNFRTVNLNQFVREVDL
jgi:hypothetical protein